MTNTTLEKWEEKTLGEICEFRNGLWTGKKEPFIECNVIRNANFSKDFKLNYDNVVRISVEEKQFHPRELKYGDLILEKSGGGPNQPVGRVVIFDKHENGYSFSNFTSLIRIKNKELINFRFLYLYLCYCYLSGMTIKMQKNSTGIRNLIFDEYKNIRAPIPNIKEQERIVAKLDKAFEVIDKVKANAEKNLTNAKELFESALNKAFTENKENWEEKKLSEVCEKITDGSHFSPQSNSNEKFPYITVKDIDNNDKINFDNCKFINQEDYDTLCRSGCRPVCGDILFSKDGTVGKVSLVDYDKQFVVLSSLAIITPMQKLIQPKFLMYILKTPRFLAEAIGRKTGVAIRRIILKNLKTISLHFPKNIAEQQKIVEKLDALQEQTKQLEAIYTKKIKECDELKQSILQKAFRGEL